MKHNLKITLLLLSMFFLTQMIGLSVLKSYSPEVSQIVNQKGELVNSTTYNLPYGLEPPQEVSPKINLISIIFALLIAICFTFLLMKLDLTIILRYWFFVVVIIALAISINAIIKDFAYSALISLAIALPLAFLKIFKRNIIFHNL